MRHFISISALALGLALPAVASAQELNLTGGVTLTSRYLAYGIPQTSGAALQPWVEAEYQGFYLGVWASNTATAITGSAAEVDLTFGYRGEADKLSYSLGYARYFYLDPNVNCCGEIIAELGYAPTDKLGLGLRIAHDPSAAVTNSSLSLDYALNDKFGLSTSYGSINRGGHEYWGISGSYALSDNASVNLGWHDTSITKGLLVLSIDTNFNLR